MDRHPALRYPSAQCEVVHVELNRPVRKALSPPVVGVVKVAAPVPTLLSCSRPPAILWRVWAVVVNAVEAMVFGRWVANVGKVVNERLAPSFAHRYATASVECKALVGWSVASGDHIHPSQVSRGVCESVFFSHAKLYGVGKT